jgi:hypothetical protein
MAEFFNVLSSNLPLTLTKGRSVSVPRRSTITLEGPDETCPSVIRSMRKGFLCRRASLTSETVIAAPSEKHEVQEAPAAEIAAIGFEELEDQGPEEN